MKNMKNNKNLKEFWKELNSQEESPQVPLQKIFNPY